MEFLVIPRCVVCLFWDRLTWDRLIQPRLVGLQLAATFLLQPSKCCQDLFFTAFGAIKLKMWPPCVPPCLKMVKPRNEQSIPTMWVPQHLCKWRFSGMGLGGGCLRLANCSENYLSHPFIHKRELGTFDFLYLEVHLRGINNRILLCVGAAGLNLC